eukprot:3166855-Amphidinium_carterae.1
MGRNPLCPALDEFDIPVAQNLQRPIHRNGASHLLSGLQSPEKEDVRGRDMPSHIAMLCILRNVDFIGDNGIACCELPGRWPLQPQHPAADSLCCSREERAFDV